MTTTVTREQVLSFRMQAQQLDRATGTIADTALLDLGAQDTGPDGALWALAVRGVDTVGADSSRVGPAELVTAWTLRGAPHVYRRADLPSVASAVQPFSEADAAKRILNASQPLKAAGITPLQALDTVAREMRAIVAAPMVKGEVSTALTARLDEPYLRWCGPCQATHAYEMPFRLGALRGGLELQAGTSPPVLQRADGLTPVFESASPPEARHDVVRATLHLLGPATPAQVAGYLEATLADVRARWPEDATPVEVDGEQRWVLEDDLAALLGADATADRLLGPYDLFLQGRDRDLLVQDPAHAKALWPVLGRPGVVLLGREVAGLWRPRKSGSKLTLAVELWTRRTRAAERAVAAGAEALAAFRGLRLAGVEYPG